MYDVGKNIRQKQRKHMQQVIQSSGWDPAKNYLKFEAHFKKPGLTLNQGKDIHISDLVDPSFTEVLCCYLLNLYNKLIPMGIIERRQNKKDLSTSDILITALADERLLEGNTLKEVKESLFNRINALPDEVLTEADKKARKRQITALLKKIRVSPESIWDLSSDLIIAFGLDEVQKRSTLFNDNKKDKNNYLTT
jgi:hypothetical protein